MSGTREDDTRADGISPELDRLSAALMGDALDLLAAGEDVNVLLVASDAKGNVASFSFSDDGIEECLEGARDKVRELAKAKGDAESGVGGPVRYAITYVGAVADETGTYQDALLLEFGEKGYRSYSAYSYFKGKGTGEGFAWTDPAPAGELEPLL